MNIFAQLFAQFIALLVGGGIILSSFAGIPIPQ